MNDQLFDPTDEFLSSDPARDPALGALLREHRLRERIGVMARRRRMRRVETPWYGLVARYGRAAVPIGIAAARAGISVGRYEAIRAQATIAPTCAARWRGLPGRRDRRAARP
jgi:hypothetical protein